MALDGLKQRIMGSVGLLKGKRKVDEEVAGKMGGMMGGLKIPGLTG